MSGARTNDVILCRLHEGGTNYYVSRNNGLTWTIATVPSITQGNTFNKVLATGEKFLATIGTLYNYSFLGVKAFVKSTDGTTWTLVCEVPNRTNSATDSYVGFSFPILIGTYYKYE